MTELNCWSIFPAVSLQWISDMFAEQDESASHRHESHSYLRWRENSQPSSILHVHEYPVLSYSHFIREYELGEVKDAFSLLNKTLLECPWRAKAAKVDATQFEWRIENTFTNAIYLILLQRLSGVQQDLNCSWVTASFVCRSLHEQHCVEFVAHAENCSVKQSPMRNT